MRLERIEAKIPLGTAAEHTEAIEPETSIAVAGPRTPMTVANVGWDLQDDAAGRFRLGLGSQIQTHIEKRFSMYLPYDVGPELVRELAASLQK